MRYKSGLLAATLALLGLGQASAQTRIVTGRVTDSITAQTLTAGQVAMQGATSGTSIKEDGTFTLAVPTRDVTLMFRSIGFKRKDVVVPASQNSVQVMLARDYFQLEAIVVTGQATGVERRNLANAVATVSAADLVRAPTASVEQSLQGKLAGASINQNNGAPGGGNIVRMRGTTSIIGSFQPLYVVDGVIVSNAEVGRGTNLVTRAYTSQGIVPTNDNQDNAVNRIADLNPNDIENVEVLKGAAAGAIYGSQAANGVILITTKRGRVGAPQFAVTQRIGLTKISNKYGTRCFNSAAEATAVFGPSAAADFQAGVCHDFEDEIYRPSISNETSASASGGTETTKYFTSLLVKHDGGTQPRNYADKQAILLNIDQNIGSRIQVAVQGNIIHSANDRGLYNNENNGSTIQSSLSSLPGFKDFRGICPDGTRLTNPGKPCVGVVYPSTQPYAFSNPFDVVGLFVNKESVWRSITTGRVNFDAITTPKHTLRLLANGGGDIFTQKNQVYSPPQLQFEASDGLLGTSVIGFGQSQSFNVNGNVVYVFKTGGGTTATTQAGIQYSSIDFDRSNIFSQNLVGGQPNVQSGTVPSIQQYRERGRDLGFFAQEEFLTLNERLLVTAGLRIDKSSNNSDAKKLYYYPKAAASYRIPVSGSLLSETKVRFAFGQSGNRPSYGQKYTNLQPGNVGGLPVSAIATVTAAPDVHAERQTEYEAGIDATMFKGRANLEVSVYQKDVKDLLLKKTVAPTAGFAQLIFNGPSIRNRGLEVSATALPIQGRSFQWQVRGTYFKNSCIVTDGLPQPFQPISFFNFAQFGTTQLQNDSSCTQIYANDSLGRLPGDAARGVIGTVVSRKIGDNAPDWRAGLSNEITYKSLKLYFLFDHQQGGLITNFSRFTFDAVGISTDQTVPKCSTCLTGNQRLAGSDKTAFGTATHVATYTKLREATLSFDLPTSAVKKLWSGARYVRMNLSGRNLLTISDYNRIGYDPEVQQVAQSLATEMTWELWAYPAARSFYFSVDVGF